MAQALLTWQGDGISQARVERRDGDDNQSWEPRGNVAVGVTSFLDTGLTLGVRYCYRVVQFNEMGDGPASVVVCGTPIPLPEAATNLVLVFAAA